MIVLLCLLLGSFWGRNALAAQLPFVLIWQDKSSGSGQETAFILQRQDVGGQFVEIARPPADATSWTEPTGLQSNVQYCYRIAATNSAGTSTWSNTVCGQRTLTQTGPMPPLVMSSQEVPDLPPVVAKINFQPTGVPIPDGYLADTGAVYVMSRGYGWSRDISDSGRDRNVNPDQRLDTFLANSHDRSGAMTTWRYDLPNGNYRVTLVSGDPGYGQGPQRIAVEGAVVVDNITTPANQFTTITQVPVTVSDGHLDIQLGPTAGNTVLNYVEIEQ